MEGNREVTTLSDKEKALEQLTKDFIMALSRDSVRRNLGGVDMMTAYVRATTYVRSLPLSRSPTPSESRCSECGCQELTES